VSNARHWLLVVIVAVVLGAICTSSQVRPWWVCLAALAALAAVYALAYRAAKRRALGRLMRGRPVQDPITSDFHRLYYDSTVFAETYWLGTPALKCPLDLWVYQEILHEIRPDLIVETGTASGGSAHFLASVCDLIGHGEIITVDIEENPDRPRHPRITYLHGSSTDRGVLEQARQRVEGRERVLVILDSDHRKEHVLAELAAYSRFVTPGSYLIVEDTNLGHPVRPDFGPGPMEAVTEFLAAHPEFTSDATREKHLLTFNPRGYLRRSSD